MILDTVKQDIRRYDMLPAGSRVVCAVSGGADSVCLLHVLLALGGCEIVCAHFNHRLRGAESDRDEAFVRALCREKGVDCVVGSGDVAGFAKAKNLGIEEAARTLRYEFLEQTAAARNCGRIATAHNAEDNAETMLLNLLRGSGLRGICGIPPVRGKLIRPLLGVSRAEIRDYLTAQGIDHVEDSSNGRDDCARNRIRHHVLPLLLAENPAAVENLCGAAALLREDEEYLSALAAHFIEEQAQDGELSVSALLALPRPVGARVILRLSGGAGRGHVEAVYALCRSGTARGAADLPKTRAVKELGRLRFCEKSAPAPAIPRQALAPGETLLSGGGWRVSCEFDTFSKEIHNSFNTFCFKNANICGKLYVASRAEGDSIRLLGRGCTKSLKKLFSEAGMPLAQRRQTPVVYDDAGPAAVYGFGIAERLAPAEGDRVLRVKISEIEKT